MVLRPDTLSRTGQTRSRNRLQTGLALRFGKIDGRANALLQRVARYEAGKDLAQVEECGRVYLWVYFFWFIPPWRRQQLRGLVAMSSP